MEMYDRCQECCFARDWMYSRKGWREGKCWLHVESGHTTEPVIVTEDDVCKYFKRED